MKVARYEFDAAVKMAAWLGLAPDAILSVIRAARGLRRWCAEICNGNIEEDENGQAFAVCQQTMARRQIPNRRLRLERRITEIVGKSGIVFQRDPRGRVVVIAASCGEQISL